MTARDHTDLTREDTDTTHITMAINDAFGMQLAVVLASLEATVPPREHYRVHVLQCDVTTETREKVTATLGSGALDVAWIDVPTDFAGEFPTNPGISREAYFRIMAPELLPASVARVIYLDADTVVVDDLTPLGAVGLGGAPLAAVRSGWCPWVSAPGGVTAWKRLGFDADAPYFNSGVLVMDCEAWRSDGLAQTVIEFIGSAGAGLEMMDQEALNAVFAGRWVELEPRWNQQPYVFDDLSMANLIWFDEELDAARVDPALIHFLGPRKPWTHPHDHPRADLWFEGLETTAWSGWRPQRPLREIGAQRLVAAWRVLRHGSVRGRRSDSL